MATWETQKGLREERHELSRQAKELVTKAATAKRTMTDEESKQWDKLIEQAGNYDESLGECTGLGKLLRQSEVSEGMEFGRDLAAILGGGPMFMSQGDGQRRTLNIDDHIVRSDKSFYDDVCRKNPEARAFEGLTPGRIMRAMVCGPKDDFERRALSEGTDSAGGYTTPTILGAQFVDYLREGSKTIQAGLGTINIGSDNHDFASLTGDPGISWHTENSSESSTDMTFGRVRFAPKTAFLMVRASRELIEDSVNLDQIVERAFRGAFASGVDQAVINGSTATTQPTGLLTLSSTDITQVVAGSTNGQPLSTVRYQPAIDALEQLEVNNVSGPHAGVLATRDYFDLAGLLATDNQPLMKPAILNDVPLIPSNRVPTNESIGSSTNASSMLFGDWTDGILGVRTDFRIEVLTERYADFYQHAFLAAMRLDFQPWHTTSFIRVVGVDPSAST